MYPVLPIFPEGRNFEHLPTLKTHLCAIMHLSIFILIIINLNCITGKLEKIKETSYCKFTQTKFSDRFDFSALTNETVDYTIAHEKDDLLTLQICKPLNKTCNGLNGYAVCYSKDGKEYAIGKEPPDVIVKFGETIFRYTGEQCDNKNNYTVNIKMICDFADKKSNDILWFPTAYNECDFNIEWRTEHACADRQQIKCSVDHESGHYDLSPLKNYSNNYEVKINETFTVVLNVCHSVLYRPNSCKSDNAACLVTNGTRDTKNLGTLSDNLKYNEEDKTLSMTYKDGAMCSERNASTDHIKTTITYICDQNKIGTLPEYVGGMEDCHYKFKWITAAACSEQVLEKKSLEEPNHSICSVKNPVTNFAYNFTSLMNREFSVHPFGVTELYEFNICGPVLNTSCTNGTGACRIRGNISGGVGNSNLLWKENGPYLNYTNGSPCGRDNKKMYTIIEFYCDNIEDYEIDERPELCYDLIKITTQLACLETPKSCVTANKKIDLNPLILRSSNYRIKSDDSDFLINVCRPLVREEKVYCPDETAICKLTKKNGKTYPVSLGLSNKNPVISTDNKSNAVLIYNDGSTCEENKDRKIESRISFICDVNSDNGLPVFTYYKSCTYFFEWKSMLACGQINGKLDKESCLISNSLGDVQSLSFLKQVMSPQFVVNNNKTYNISLCGFNECNGGFICTDNVMYGTNVNIVFDYSINSIQINFTQGTQCSDGSKAKSSIKLICDELSSTTKPVIIREETCNVEFQWSTSKICQRQNSNTVKTRDLTSEPSTLSGGQIAGMIFAIFLILAVIVYSTRRWHLIELITNSSRHCDHVRYSRVNTEEEVHLLLDASDPNVIDTDSDDDLLQA